MKNKKLTLLGVLVCALISMASTSCGGSNDTDNTIYFWHTFGQDIYNRIDGMARKFEKLVLEKEGVEVHIANLKDTYQGSYDDLIDKVTKSFTTGSTPTICVAYPDHVATYLTYDKDGKSYVNNLDSYFTDPEIGFIEDDYLNPNGLGVEDFVPSFIDEGRHYAKEGTYSLPFMKSTEIMLYNKDVLNQVLFDLGIQQAADVYMQNITWDAFMELLNYVNENLLTYFPNSATQQVVPLFYDSDSNLFISQSYQRGIDFISMKNGEGSIDFDNPEAKAMVQEFKDLYDDGMLLTKATNGDKFGSDFFKANRCLFVVGSTGGTGYNDPKTNFEVGVCKFPIYKTATAEQSKYVSQGVTLCLMNNYGVSEEVNQFRTEYGWKFLKYITSTSNNIDASLASNGYIPSRLSCYEDEYYKEYLQYEDFMSICAKTVIEEINGQYFNYPVFKGSDEARNQVGGIIAEYLSDKNTDLDALFATAVNNTKLKM